MPDDIADDDPFRILSGTDVIQTSEEKPKLTTRRSPKPKDKDFEVVPVNRKVRTFRISESELNQISECNSTSEWFGKATCSLFSFVIALTFDVVIQGAVNEFAKGVLYITVPVFGGAAILCGVKWYLTHQKVSDFRRAFFPAEDADLG